LLAEGTRALNLTSVREPAEIERRHVADALALIIALEETGLLPRGARVVDVGSGGGLPGVPLAIMRPDLSITLLEATGKKAAFLRTTTAQLALPHVRVLALRAEEAGHLADEREQYDLAVARAVAPLAALVELTLPMVRVGGVLAAVKGSRAEAELREAAGAIARCGGGVPRIISLPRADTHLRLILVPKRTATPADLPRRPGMPAKHPLR